MSVASRWGRRAIEASRRSVTWLCILLLCFLFLGYQVRYSQLQNLDISVSKEVQEINYPGLDQAMQLISHTGAAVTLIVLGCALAALLAYKKHFRTAKYVLLSLLSLPLDYVLKEIWKRERPDAEHVHILVNRAGHSFPSGHALGSTAVYGFLAVLAWIHLKDHSVRLPAVLFFGLLPVFVCLSRVYLGAHWFSDVIGGMTLGILVTLALTSAYRKDKREVAKPIDTSAEQAPT
jgi:undecaprenyl-diphosphatase